MLVFALTVTALIGGLVIVVGIGLVLRKASFILRTRQEATLDDLYLQKLSPLLLEELASGNSDPESLRYRQECQTIFDPLRREVAALGYFRKVDHRAALKRVALRMSSDLVGETRMRLTQGFKILGFVADELKDLGSRHWWVRARACRNLALMRAEEATADFVILLNDDEEDVRTEAAMALVTISGISALRPLFANLRKISLWMSIQLSRVVLAMGSRAVPDLVEGLKSEQETVMSFCAEMLGFIGDIAACEPLVEAAKTRDVRLRSRALLAIGKLGDERGKEALFNALSDENEQCRESAALGLGMLGSPEAVVPLKEHLLHDTVAVRLASGKSLARLEDWGRDVLVSAFREADSIGKRIIEQFLEELGIDGQTMEGSTL